VFASQKNHSFFAIHQATSPNQIRWTRLLLKAGGVLERTRPSHKIQGSQIPTIEYREGGDPLDYPTKEKRDMVKSPLRMSLWRSEQSTMLSRIARAIQTGQKRFWSTAILSMLLPTWKKHYVASEYETRDRSSESTRSVSAKRISRSEIGKFFR
jgi:hypothetical protein